MRTAAWLGGRQDSLGTETGIWGTVPTWGIPSVPPPLPPTSHCSRKQSWKSKDTTVLSSLKFTILCHYRDYCHVRQFKTLAATQRTTAALNAVGLSAAANVQLDSTLQLPSKVKVEGTHSHSTCPGAIRLLSAQPLYPCRMPPSLSCHTACPPSLELSAPCPAPSWLCHHSC